jgi:O-antigen/teichoic acid export membrane protein
VDSSSARVREGLSSVTRGTLFLLTATLLFVFLTFIARVIVVQSITPEQWSAFSWGLTLAGLLAAFGTLGLPNAIARSLPYSNSDAERRGMVRGTVMIAGVAGAIVTVILWVVGPPVGARLGEPDIGLALQFFSVAVGVSIAANLIASIFQGYEDVTPNALFLQIVNPALFVLFLGAFLFAHRLTGAAGGLGYENALIAYAAASVITLALVTAYGFVTLPRRLPAGPRDPSAFPKLLRFAVPLFLAGILSTVTGSGDTLILGVFTPASVGTYTASLTLARLLQVGIGAAAYIFLPVTTRFFRSGDTPSIRMTYATVTKWTLLFSLPLFVVFFFEPSRSLGFVYGDRYRAVIAPLEILVVGAFASTLFGPGAATQVALGQTRLVAYNSLVAAVADVGLSFGLVPLYGSVGAAVAWASAAGVVSGLSVFELALLDGIHPFRVHVAVPVLVTGVPIGIALAVLRPALPLWSLPVLGLGVAAAFVGVVFATRSVDRGDQLFLHAVEEILGRPVPLVRRLSRWALGPEGPR